MIGCSIVNFISMQSYYSAAYVGSVTSVPFLKEVSVAANKMASLKSFFQLPTHPNPVSKFHSRGESGTSLSSELHRSGD